MAVLSNNLVVIIHGLLEILVQLHKPNLGKAVDK